MMMSLLRSTFNQAKIFMVQEISKALYAKFNEQVFVRCQTCQQKHQKRFKKEKTWSGFYAGDFSA